MTKRVGLHRRLHAEQEVESGSLITGGGKETPFNRSITTISRGCGDLGTNFAGGEESKRKIERRDWLRLWERPALGVRFLVSYQDRGGNSRAAQSAKPHLGG